MNALSKFVTFGASDLYLVLLKDDMPIGQMYLGLLQNTGIA